MVVLLQFRTDKLLAAEYFVIEFPVQNLFLIISSLNCSNNQLGVIYAAWNIFQWVFTTWVLHS